jgi:hypothetical protein
MTVVNAITRLEMMVICILRDRTWDEKRGAHKVCLGRAGRAEEGGGEGLPEGAVAVRRRGASLLHGRLHLAFRIR